MGKYTHVRALVGAGLTAALLAASCGGQPSDEDVRVFLRDFGPSLRDGLQWLATNVSRTMLAFTGAFIAYMFMGMPESRTVKKRVRTLLPKLANDVADRVVALILICTGTVIAMVLLQPSSNSAALYAGISWQSVLAQITNYVETHQRTELAAPKAEA